MLLAEFPRISYEAFLKALARSVGGAGRSTRSYDVGAPSTALTRYSNVELLCAKYPARHYLTNFDPVVVHLPSYQRNRYLASITRPARPTHTNAFTTSDMRYDTTTASRYRKTKNCLPVSSTGHLTPLVSLNDY
jgi:hypothetical protein